MFFFGVLCGFWLGAASALVFDHWTRMLYEPKQPNEVQPALVNGASNKPHWRADGGG